LESSSRCVKSEGRAVFTVLPDERHYNGLGIAHGGLAATLLLTLVALVMWVRNPFAALLLVPALHLWMWLGAGELPLPRAVRLGLVGIGAAAPSAAVAYYALTLGLSVPDTAWNLVLMISRGDIGAARTLLWSVALGCFAAILVLAIRGRGGTRAEPVAITVRGPVSYAGPGSLGGTSSALRRR